MERGGQPGNNNGGKNKPWADAVRNALVSYSSGNCAGGRALHEIAHKVVAMALEGDHMAIAEIANRLDGKPRQEVDATVDGSLTVVIREFVLSASEPKLVGHGQAQGPIGCTALHEPELIEHAKQPTIER